MAPRSVAMVGASPTSRHGRPMIQNFATLGFPGEVMAVNPRYEEILGVPCFGALRDLPTVPDAVMVGVNKERAWPVLEDAAELGVGGVVLTAIGFAETGVEGRHDQDLLTAFARDAGLALIGPNCMGLVNFSAASALYLDEVSEAYTPGRTALISNSGSVAVALMNNARGVRWSHVVTTGNEAVTGSAELIGYAVHDPDTDVIAAFIETIRDPEAFFAACDRASAAGKPVVILKAGRSQAAQAAAQAHSGALAVSDRLVDALFRRHRVIRVDSMEDLLDTVTLLSVGRRPAHDGVAIVSESGGEVELFLDAAANRSLRLPAFGDPTRERLATYLPEGLEPHNPLDLWALDDTESNYPRLLSDLLEDPDVALLMAVVQTDSGPTIPGDVLAQGVAAATVAALGTEKPVALVAPLSGGAPADLVEHLRAADVAMLSSLTGALRSVEHVIAYAIASDVAAEAAAIDHDEVQRRFAALEGRPTAGQPALELLAAAGIPTVRSEEVSDVEAAVAAAECIGYPVVLKLGDPGLLHKTEAGGVLLDLRDQDAVRDAVTALRSTPAGATCVLVVQQQITGGLELILGLQHDPQLGGFTLVGTGGIWAEVVEDVSIRPIRLRLGEAQEMLSALRASRIMAGLRGRPALDVAAAVDALERLDALAAALDPRIASLDVNPLVVLPTGVVALDALVVPNVKEAG